MKGGGFVISFMAKKGRSSNRARDLIFDFIGSRKKKNEEEDVRMIKRSTCGFK